ncbi:MAG: SDR family NAD(P)-dependent oxidoreductase [Spirochaetia bacterium]|jgi:NAD(P)-dependent dehydrogenase (short-subunit alcohol dehydrogenase family)
MKPMQGKTVVITGPTSGIGREIATGLARLGANLVLGCRDAAAGKVLAGELGRTSEASSIEVAQVDLSSQKSIAEFSRQILERHARLDVLVNNAAVSRGTQPWARSADEIELTFATNVMGYFLMSEGLLPSLRENAHARIVNVASTFASDLDLDDLQFQRRPFESMKAYAQSKACDRLLTWALARRLEGSGVTANAMAPGLIVDTGLYRHTPREVMAQLRQRGGGRTPSDGADTAVWLASSPDIEGVTGKFFENRKEIPCSFRNRETEERLWSICEGLAK